MQIKVKEFNQEEYEKSILRVLPSLSLVDKKAVRDTLIAVADAVDNALEIQKTMDQYVLETKKAEVKTKKPIPEPIEEDENVYEAEDVLGE